MEFLAALAHAADLMASESNSCSVNANLLEEVSPLTVKKRSLRGVPRRRQPANTVQLGRRKRPVSNPASVRLTVRLKLEPLMEEMQPVSILRKNKSYLKAKKDIPIFPARTVPGKMVTFVEDVLCFGCPMDENSCEARRSYNMIPFYLQNRLATVMAQLEEEAAI